METVEKFGLAARVSSKVLLLEGEIAGGASDGIAAKAHRVSDSVCTAAASVKRKHVLGVALVGAVAVAVASFLVKRK